MVLEEINMNRGLSQNQLKLIAAVSMLLDHIGAELFPQIILLRVIGRLSFPLFSYFIYEGFNYTQNRKRYFFRILLLGIVCVVVYYLYSGEIYGNVLITFTLSLMMLRGVEICYENSSVTAKDMVVGLAYVAGCIMIVLGVNVWIYVDYDMIGVLLPAFAKIASIWNNQQNKYSSRIGFGIGLLFLSVHKGGIQYFSLIAILLLFAYNGRRGTKCLKHFFYWFYPVHLAAIGIISMFI